MPDSEIDQYSRSMYSTFRFVGVAAGTLYAIQWFLALISNKTSASTSTPTIPYPSANLEAAGVAVTLLITAAVAVQVFLRLPRDPERFTKDDAVSQRQFWGPVATLIAVGSAFLVPYVLIDSIVSSTSSGTLNLASAIGIPLVAVLALIFASDAVTIVSEEARKERLAQKLRQARIDSLRATEVKIHGMARNRPRAALILNSIIFGSLLVAVGTGVAWMLIEQRLLTFAFAVLSSLCTTGLIIVSTQAIPTILRGRVMEAIFQVLLPVLAITLVSIQSIILALPFVRSSAGPEDYIPPIAYGMLVAVPSFATVTLLCTLRIKRDYPAAMLDFARTQIRLLRERYEREKEHHRSDSETWRILAGSAILFSPIPFVALFLSASATWHRKYSSDRSGGLHIAGWVIPILVAIVEALALLLVAFYGPKIGWFQL
ncbi:hypothetical protein [Brevibacterium sp. 'Marine']|uniref:hypothetical protein n=1 Tax=Brevibacterium sp. 'Marine' TaxID=2725563 RepID=UPI00145EA478|nr:hypothetical protein [Brevibacterium sp. 'Marine']